MAETKSVVLLLEGLVFVGTLAAAKAFLPSVKEKPPAPLRKKNNLKGRRRA